MNQEKELFYIVEGEQVPLIRIDSVRLVVPAKGRRVNHMSAKLARSSRLGIDTSAPSNYLVVRGDPDKLQEIRHYSNIQCTRSAFMDKHGLELILTNDILVKFSDAINTDERHNLCKKLNCLGAPLWRDEWSDTKGI